MTKPMLNYAQAVTEIQNHTAPLPTESIELAQLFGRIAAIDAFTPFALPRFANSAMDGFALDAAQTSNASEAHPLTLKIAAVLAAGDDNPTELCHNTIEIMTGASIPNGANAVIPIEHVEILKNGDITIHRAVEPFENVRHAGEDFQINTQIIAKGERIHAGHIAVLASFGYARLEVHQKPRVALMSTGKEIISDYATPLAPSQIYNSNSPYLAAQLAEIGIDAEILSDIGDDEIAFKNHLQHTKADIIISTGAVSMGKWDFIPDVLRECGATIVFHKVAIKPGKPILFAQLPDGRYFFGLPGNPSSCAVGLRFFVAPLIRALQNMPPEQFLSIPLFHATCKKGDFKHFLKAHWDASNHKVSILGGQESFKISPLITANAWVILDETQHDCGQGDAVWVAPSPLL